MIRQGQKLTFSGVGAHHQNGRAEKRIRDLQDLARTSLIHANRMWPDAITSNLWPYALRHANDSINKSHFKGKDITPIEIFSGSDVVPDVTQSHPFGCPAYALDGNIQGGQKAPKWDSRARMAIYLGASAQHASTVGLLLSLTTGLASPQFHVRFDDTFQTLRKPSYVVPSMWQRMAGFQKSKQASAISKEPTIPIQDIPITENTTNDPTRRLDQGQLDNQHEQDEIRVEVEVVNEDEDEERNQIADEVEQPVHQSSSTRSGRVSHYPKRYEDYVSFSANATVYEGDTDDEIIESAFAASSDPDVLYLHEALKAPDSNEFIKAMDKEVRSHEENVNWVIVDRCDIPEGKKVVPSIWAMRRKQNIATQEVYKWKARLNFHEESNKRELTFGKHMRQLHRGWPFGLSC